MNRKEQYSRLMNTARWRELRRWKLSRNPLCEQCAENDKVTPAVEVHHVKPVEDGRSMAEMSSLAYDLHNLRSLCHKCHVNEHKALGRTGKDYAKRRRRDERQKFRSLFIDRKEAAGASSVASGGVLSDMAGNSKPEDKNKPDGEKNGQGRPPG